MLNINLLNETLEKSGYKRSYIAEKLNLTTYGLSLKLNGYNEFKASEIYKLSELLKLSLKERDEIFFANFSELNSLKNKEDK